MFILKILRNSLSFKIIAPIVCLLMLWGLIYWYKFIFKVNQEQINQKTEETLLNLEIVRNSINYNMLLNHSAAIEKTIENVGSIKRIPTLILLDHKGNIKFSSDKNKAGKAFANTESICTECHSVSKNGQYSLKEVSKNWYIKESTHVLRAFIPVRNEESCYTAPCHIHSPSAKINGIIVAELPLDTIYEKLRDRSIDSIIYGMVFFSFIVVTLYMLLSKWVTKPAILVYEGLKMVSRGYVGHTLEINSSDEMGDVQRAYNEMTRELRVERTDYQEKTRKLSDIMEQKSIEIRKTQEQYMHTEKLASLGRMAAGVAHELNSPLTGIIIFAQLLLKRLPAENKQDLDDLKVIIEQAEKCSNIIAVLLGYSRAIPSEKVNMEVNKTIESALAILQNQAKFYNVTTEKVLVPNLPRVAGDPSQLEQVFINLLINSADAMNGKGKVVITTKKTMEGDDPFVEIRFSDNGPGIPEDVLVKIFEPFFTTKPEGKGTGLGLAVSKGIIQKLGGSITVNSKIGEGTTFSIHLPALKLG